MNDKHSTRTAPRVAVVVVGDLGRSPRMQAHALALANRGASVDLVGYGDSPVYPEIERHPGIRVHELRLPRLLRRQPRGRLRYVFAAISKLLIQHCQLFHALLFRITRPSVLLVQNPPPVPTLLVGRIAARVRGAHLIIDWHNFGCDVLALRLGRSHPMVRLLGFYERGLGRRAHSHFCVSRMMRDRLLKLGRIAEPVVLRDHPPDWFARWGAPERRGRLCDLGRRIDVTAMQQDDVPVIVCPTSWTADEDFELLLDGLERFDGMLSRETANVNRVCPSSVLVMLTGRGELKSRYETRIAGLSLSAIQVKTAWLSHEDYRCLLCAADLGLCLHRSASGVDLPYKVPEMFGAGLPAGVFDYGRVIGECCTAGVNCFTFSASDELARQLFRLLGGYPHDTELLDQLRQGTVDTPSWQEEWNRVAPASFGLPAGPE